MPAEDYDPDGLTTVTVQLYNRQLGLLAAEKGRSRYVRAAFELLEDGSLDPWMRAGGTPGVALRRAVDEATRAWELERALRKAQDRIYYAVDWRHEEKDEALKRAWREIDEALREGAAPDGGEEGIGTHSSPP